MNARLFLALLLSAPLLLAEPKPVPRMQAVPQPHDQVSFQRDGVEIARYHFGDDNSRPFLFPVIGPSGRSLTRMGHPHDPVTHSHHNSVWVSHQFINGVNFWEDRPGGARIAHQRVDRLEDGESSAFVEETNHWLDKDGKVLMHERRRVGVQSLEKDEWLLLLDMQWEARDAEVTVGETAFGPFAVRMAKTIGVIDGGGTIRNSEGGVDEAGCFRKPAKWVDYSGPITPTASEGITLMDHPANPHHPVPFHVRNDGWMGASLTFPGELKIAPGQPLRLRYALYVHSGVPALDVLDAQWQQFAKTDWLEFPAKR
ncbi:MAG: PmoA family protein [Chthoniobacteraceae bacterium]